MRTGAMDRTDAVDTINAAATLIASAPENRVPQFSIQKRRWGSWLNLYSCFGSHRNDKRIGHAVLIPETSGTRTDAPTAEHASHPSTIVLPFIAPPSSPASFLPSEPPSAIHSPTGLLSLSVSANMCSPGGSASMFAIGPYAYETQLVSPPVFSTFTTEPSTAPYTPPTDSYLTTPSSPEVPFAQFLEPNIHNHEASLRYPISQYEFQSYQLQPGSPGSHLISPCSGTSSPYPYEFTRHPFFLEFKTGNPPKPLDKNALREQNSFQASGAVTPDYTEPRSCHNGPLSRQHSDVSPLPDLRKGSHNDDAVDNRVSFEITAEEVIRCVEKKPMALTKTLPESVENVENKLTGEEKSLQKGKLNDLSTEETFIYTTENMIGGGENQHKRQKNRTITLGSTKEFNFGNVDGGNSDEPNIRSDWWANEKVLGEEVESSENWSFFPMVHTSLS